MKVGILTMFNGLNRTYSLVNIVAEQLTMLLNAGIKTKLLVSEDCPFQERFGVFLDPRLEWCKITNRLNNKQIKWHDYSRPNCKPHDTFFAEAEHIAVDLVKHLADVEVCFLHDILYQGWHLVHNVALRKAQDHLPDTRFVSFTHSLPVNRPPQPQWPFSARFTPLPKTIYAYPTQSGLPALAKQYDVPEGKCRVVNNSLDLLAGMSNALCDLAKNVDLFSPDILMVYPGRLTPGKQFEKLTAFAGAIKKQTEREVRVIFCDFPSLDIDPETYKRRIRSVGINFGLGSNDLFFTSDLGYPHGFPRDSVLELFIFSNLFICPSYSESFGLTVLEAASRGNFLVLNQAVPALEELGKHLHAYFMRWDARNFGYDTQVKYHPSEKAYLAEHGERIVNLMRENPVVYGKTLIRQRYSPSWIWKNQLEPLLGL